MPQGTPSREIYEILYGEIMTLQLRPGDILRENELCTRFAVSRTPIRSVLQELRIGGLVEVTPYKNTRVTLLDYDSICQQIYLRTAVESAVLSDFCAVCTPEQLQSLRLRNEAIHRAAAGNVPLLQFYEMDSRLHKAWFTAMRKEHIWQIIQHSQNSYSRFRMLDLVEAGGLEQIAAEHDALLDALAKRDVPRVQALIHAHLNGGIARLGNEPPARFSAYFVPDTPWPGKQ